MKKPIIAGLLIGILLLYGGYNLISSSGNQNTIDETIDSNEITRTYGFDDDNEPIMSDIDNNQDYLNRDKENISNSNDVEIEAENKSGNEAEYETENQVGSEVETLLVNDTGNEAETKLGSEVENGAETKMENSESDGVEQLLPLSADTVNSPVDDSTNIDSATTESMKAPVERVSLVEEIFVHRVSRGDNLWVIANKYDINIDTLIGANDITNMNKIQIGDELRILPIKGILYKINPGESLWTISRKFDITIKSIVEANAIVNPDLVKPGVSLILPGARPEFGYSDRLSKRFIKPINARISSYFGPRWGKQHEGIDWAVNVGTKVRAARSGKVIYSDWASGYGYTVVIEHQKGVRTLYAHNSKLLVHGGQWVEQGQVISLSGNTGRSTGPHLHFEIQINGRPVNPLNYLE
ncbi:MAG: peptidoglycan DD-metalloendopeptidase family protein [Halanaerobiales bacterium]